MPSEFSALTRTNIRSWRFGAGPRVGVCGSACACTQACVSVRLRHESYPADAAHELTHELTSPDSDVMIPGSDVGRRDSVLRCDAVRVKLTCEGADAEQDSCSELSYR